MTVHARAEMATPSIDEHLIEQHVGMLHCLAGASSVEGVLVLFAVGENPVTGEKVGPYALHFNIGDAKGMADQAKAWARHAHVNVYAPFAVFRKGLERGKRARKQTRWLTCPW